jgi:hypothetical protein
MKKFEYKVEPGLGNHSLNELGRQGWELVTIERDYKTGKHYFYFKKEIN